MEKLFQVILSDFTEKDWQDVKDEIKEFIVSDFKNMWGEYYVVNVEIIENAISDRLDDYIRDMFKELFEEKDMKKLFMETMMEKMNGVKE